MAEPSTRQPAALRAPPWVTMVNFSKALETSRHLDCSVEVLRHSVATAPIPAATSLRKTLATF
eukprot:1161340-Pelagomonas_calceolata.AAC.14